MSLSLCPCNLSPPFSTAGCVTSLCACLCVCVCVCVQDSAGESLYMLFRAIKHQVDKGPVDAVTGKAKYTLNDNRLLREDVEYKTLVRTTHTFSTMIVGI